MNPNARASVLCWVLATLAVCAVPAPAAAQSWLEARSAHFVIVSNGHETHVRRVALEFERARRLLAEGQASRPDTPGPVTILAVEGERRLREILPQFWERRGRRPAGAYWPGAHEHRIALRLDAPAHERFARVLHEYAHLVTHTHLRDVPAWLDEGMSELWGAAVVREDSVLRDDSVVKEDSGDAAARGEIAVEIGHPVAQHLKVLRGTADRIPLEELLAMERPPDPRDSKRLSLFYAQAWALAHYLTLGRAAPRPLAIPSIPTSDELPHLTRDLDDYLRDGRFRIVRISTPTERDDLDSDVRVRSMTEAESLALRAAFLVDGERPAAAEPLLEEALRRDPGNVAAMETRASLYFRQNEPRQAAAWFDRAIATGSASHLSYYYRAILTGPVPGPQPADAYLRKALELNPDFAPARDRLADFHTDGTGRPAEPAPR